MGKYKESAKQTEKEIKYMKKGGAPKELIRHERKEKEVMKKGAK